MYYRQTTAYEVRWWVECRRVAFRSQPWLELTRSGGETSRRSWRSMGALLVHPAFQRKPDYHAPRPPEMSLEEAGACEVCESQDLAFESAARLLGLVRNLQDSGNILVEYVDANRDEARKAGIESIAIELTAIFEGGRLQKIRE